MLAIQYWNTLIAGRTRKNNQAVFIWIKTAIDHDLRPIKYFTVTEQDTYIGDLLHSPITAGARSCAY